MAKIDLITVIHPEDIRFAKQKYTFYAPANSEISEDDYILVNDNKIAKVVSVLHNVDEEGDTVKFIRSVSSLGDKKLKPVVAKLKPEYIIYNDSFGLDSIIGPEALDNYLKGKTESKVQETYIEKQRLNNN